MSLDYAGSRMDHGLPDFLIQLPVVSTRSDISLPSRVSRNVFSQPSSTFHPRHPPTTHFERDSRDQQSMAMQWLNISKEIDSLLKEIQSEIHVTMSPEEAKKFFDLPLEKWDWLEGQPRKQLSSVYVSLLP